jgi:peptidyl-prolyl cis-trans isomerase D
VQQVYAEIAPRAFRVPSYRAVTIVAARLSDFVARVNIPEERIRELFETSKAGLSQPEKRSFVQIVAQTSAQANQAAQRLARGEDAAAVARALNLQHIAFTQKARTEIPDPAVARAVFAMRSGAAPQAVRAEVAPYAAIKLGEVVPGVEARYEDHRDEIRGELARQEAHGLREEAITAFTDALDAGTPIAQAAAAHGLSATVVPAVDEQGRTPDGQPAEAFLDEPDLVRAAFETEQGETSDFFPAQNGDETLLQVDNVTPERTMPLAQVRAQVVEYWKGRERARRLNAIGDRVVQAVNSGRPFADAVAAEGGTIFARSEVVRRQDAARTITQLFSVRDDEAAMAVNPTATVALVAQVEEIRRANPSEQAAAVEEMRREAQQGLVQSLGEVVQRLAENAANVKRNPELLERQYSRGDAQDQ